MRYSIGFLLPMESGRLNSLKKLILRKPNSCIESEKNSPCDCVLRGGWHCGGGDCISGHGCRVLRRRVWWLKTQNFTLEIPSTNGQVAWFWLYNNLVAAAGDVWNQRASLVTGQDKRLSGGRTPAVLSLLDRFVAAAGLGLVDAFTWCVGFVKLLLINLQWRIYWVWVGTWFTFGRKSLEARFIISMHWSPRYPEKSEVFFVLDAVNVAVLRGPRVERTHTPLRGW